MILAILPVVSIQTIPIHLFLRILIHNFSEVTWYEIVSRVLFSQMAGSPLLCLQPIFLINCKLDITVFYGTLIRPQPCICRCYLFLQFIGEIVQLQSKITELVHVLKIVWKGCDLPQFNRFNRVINLCILSVLVHKHLLGTNLFAPSSKDFMSREFSILILNCFLNAIINKSFQIVSIFTSATFGFEVNYANFTCLIISNYHLTNLLRVSSSKDQILHKSRGPLDRKMLTS